MVAAVVGHRHRGLGTPFRNGELAGEGAVDRQLPANGSRRGGWWHLRQHCLGAIQSLSGVVDNGPNNFPSSVGITLTWDLAPSIGAVQVIGYFSNPAVAMANGPVSIPSSWIRGRVLTAGVQGAPTTYTPFTQNGAGGVGSAGGSLLLFSQPILGYSKIGTLTVDLQLQLDLTGCDGLRPTSISCACGHLLPRARQHPSCICASSLRRVRRCYR